MEPKPPSGRRAREIERTRQDIVQAAARVFAQRGYHAATMQVIAREAGFTAASLYTYFSSKDAIYAALVDDLAGAMMGVFDMPEPAGLTFRQRLELLLQRQLSLAAERRDALRILFDMGPPQDRPCDDPRPREYLERSARFLAEAGDGALRIPPREAALLLHGVAHALILSWLLDDAPADPAHRAAHLADLFLHGAGSAQATPPPDLLAARTGDRT
jgi:AcrR family transcriptional regulator